MNGNVTLIKDEIISETNSLTAKARRARRGDENGIDVGRVSLCAPGILVSVANITDVKFADSDQLI
jgi:hypothetical protein